MYDVRCTAIKRKTIIASGITPLVLIYFIGQNIYYIYPFSKPEKEMRLKR